MMPRTYVIALYVIVFALSACGTGDINHDWLDDAPQISQNKDANTDASALDDPNNPSSVHSGHAGHR